ncbi:MAG: gliding motility-associated C-terminal domain-containing protein [Bacteroidaceae bacterium]|nr:gliding motility-associated C-terminal domain-containing protein [Bacteroidaceae bacterium]
MKDLTGRKILMIFIPALIGCLTCFSGVPVPSVKLTLITVSNDTTYINPGESGSESYTVPLKVEFSSSIVSDDGKEYVLFPEWQVLRTYTDGETSKSENYLKRQESNTDFEFTDWGNFQVSFSWSYRDKDSLNTIPGYEIAPMSFVIDDSEVKLFNAFSPNEDGINDDYRIYVRSIARLEIAIFNRWGQLIKSISGKTEDILTAEDEATRDADGGYLINCWDGKHNGKVVSDGVYFINVKAVGAGGKVYERRADINVLTGTGIRM